MASTFASAFAYALALWAMLVQVVHAKEPIILIPGLAGSVFKAKLRGSHPPHWWCSKSTDEFYTIWLSIEEALPLQKDCLLSHLLMDWNETSKRFVNAPGVQLDTNVDFGGVGGISSLDPNLAPETGYFRSMIKYLQRELGYTVGQDLHGAPYDWRLAPDGWSLNGEFYDKLTALLESTVARNQAPAHVVTHSLGGPAFLGFLHSKKPDWVRRHVTSFIPINAPFAGSVKQIKADILGDNFDVPIIPNDYLKPVQDSAPSGSFLLPTSQAVFGDTPILTTPTRVYKATVQDMLAMLQDLGLSRAHRALDILNRTSWNLDVLMRKSPGELGVLHTHIITSSGVKTTERFTTDQPLTPTFAATLESQMASYSTGAANMTNGTVKNLMAAKLGLTPVIGDGDGTVNAASLQSARKMWGALNHNANSAKLDFFDLPGVSHFSMVSDERVFAYVKACITNTSMAYVGPEPNGARISTALWR